MDFTWKDWESAQRMIDLYEQNRFQYNAYLLWLLFQSLVVFVILVALVGSLIFFTIYTQDMILMCLTLIWLISWLWGIFSSVISDPCQGMFLVDKRKYRKIYDNVNEISRRIEGPKIHRIYINEEYNAAATNRYLFTPFKRNILILGYPLMAAMSYHGLVGCLAHEIGHIKYKHMSLCTWINLANEFWSNVHLGILNIIFLPWLRYWLPAFNDAIAPLYRQQEIDADKYIVKTFGENYLSACEVELKLKEVQYSDVMDKLMEKMRSDSWEQCDILKLYRDGLNEDMPKERKEQIISRALRSLPNVFEEHPSFAQRLELADCCYPMIFTQFDADALDEFFGHNGEFDYELNAHFHEIMDDYAQNVRTNAEGSRILLEQNPPSVKKMNESELLDALDYYELAGQKKERLQLLEQCIDAFPNFLQFRAIRALEHAKDDPDEAAAELEYCISKAPELYQIDEQDFLLRYYINSGDVVKIHAYIDLKNKRTEQLEIRFQKPLDADDILESDQLPENTLNYLVEEFKEKYIIVSRAYCVRRLLNDKTAIAQVLIVLDSDLLVFTKFPMNLVVRELSEEFAETDYYFITCRTDFCDKYLEPLPGARFYSKK